MGGDWNVLLDTHLDYASANGSAYSNNEGSNELRELMARKGLRDVFREHNPRERMYTRHDEAHECYTRLDRWLAPATGRNHYEASTDVSYTGSDHTAIYLHVTTSGEEDRGTGRHRIDPRILESPEVRRNITTLTHNTFVEFPSPRYDRSQVWEIYKGRLRKC